MCIYVIDNPHTGALSVTDDDYCVSYTVTMVDVRSCTRTPRLPCHIIHSDHNIGMLITNKQSL